MSRRVRPPFSHPQAVVAVGLLMILGQLAFRGWMLRGGYWLIDDYGFLAHAVQSDFTLAYLFEPYNDHFQVIGNAIAWLIAASTPYNWPLAAVITLIMQALASLAALVFLIRLAGQRWVVLLPLGFYLFSAMTVPGFVWWAAAIVQIPQQLAAFLAMATHLEFVRTGRRRWVLFTIAALVLGGLSDVKVLFTGAALMFLSLYFTEGQGPRQRLVNGVWRARSAWISYAVLFGGYLAAYATVVDVGGRSGTWRDTVSIFEVMLRSALGPVLAGGPWRWGEMADSPLVPAMTPEWAVTMTWVAFAVLFMWAGRWRRTVLWALVPLLLCVAVNAVMVSTARGAIFGRLLGAEVRYLGDLAPVATLAVAVIVLWLPPSRTLAARHHNVLELSRRARVVATMLVVGLAAGSVISSAKYAANWHSDFASRKFVSNVIARTSLGPLEVLDAPLPEFVVPRESAASPFARPSKFFAPLGPRLRTVVEGNDLQMLDQQGNAVGATVTASAAAVPGKVPGCGTAVTMDGVTRDLVPIPASPAVPDRWYVQISYLASANGELLIAVGDREERIEIESGLHTYVMPGYGKPFRLRMQAITPGLVVCIDRAQVGGLEGGVRS